MINAADVRKLLKRLAERRPIFCSEADFQHEFALLLRETNRNFNVRLEYPLSGEKNRAVDVFLYLKEKRVAFELKYLCKEIKVSVEGEEFVLKNQSAHDVRRYDVCKDIERMEEFVHGQPKARYKSYVITLTNDPAYWEGPKKEKTYDREFSLKEGRCVRGTLKWDEKASKGTTEGREPEIEISGPYEMVWETYHEFNDTDGALVNEANRTFRFLLVEAQRSPE